MHAVSQQLVAAGSGRFVEEVLPGPFLHDVAIDAIPLGLLENPCVMLVDFLVHVSLCRELVGALPDLGQGHADEVADGDDADGEGPVA